MLQVIAPGAFKTVSRHHRDSPPYDHVYFDVNNSIHRLAMRSKTEEEFYLRLFAEIDSAVGFAQPRKSVFIAIDGPGPRAKVATQLSRRRKLDPNSARDLKRLGFTPGTLTLQRLKQALCVYAGQRISQRSNQDRAYYVSGADSPGEGELKAFDHMRSLSQRDRCLVVGNDSDLIAFGLQAPCRVDVVRSMEKGQMAMVSIPKIKKALCKGLLKPSALSASAWEQRIADDFVFLCIMSGNDYLPKVGSFALHSCWTQYRLHQRNERGAGSFLFDAKQLTCDWQLFGKLARVFQGSAKQNSNANDSSVKGALPHPKTLLNQLMNSGGNGSDNAIYTFTQDENMVYNCEVSLFRGALKFSATDVGKQKASIQAALKALAPGSELWSLMEATYAKPQLVDCKKLINSFEGLRAAYPNPAFGDYRVGTINVTLTDADAATGSRHMMQPRESMEQSPELLRQFYEAMIWSFQLYQGRCRDYGYLFPHGDIIINKQRLCDEAPTLSDAWGMETKNPLPPVVLGLCLLPGAARVLLPEPFRTIDMEKSDISHLFANDNEELAINMPKLSENLDRVEAWAGDIEEEQLSADAKHLLQLSSPLVFMRKDNVLFRRNSGRVEFQKMKYESPTLPELPGNTEYRRLKAPNNHPGVICAQAESGGILSPNTPYMVRSMSTMARMGRRILRK